MNDSFTREQILSAYNSAPDPVRAAYSSEQTTQVIADLQSRLKLHTVTASSIGKGVAYMLLGFADPAGFLKILSVAGISDADAKQIITEVNQKIFIPLRSQMQSGAGQATPVAQPAAPTVPTAQQPRVNAPVPNYAPPPPPPPPPPRTAPRAYEMPPPSVIIQANPMMPTRPQQQDYIHKVSRYTPPRPPAPQPQAPHPSVNVMQARPAAPVMPQQPISDTSSMLEDHEEPSPQIGATGYSPRPSVSRITPPTPSMPPANLPGAMPPPQSRPFPPPPPAPRPPIDHYSADPYHEPI